MSHHHASQLSRTCHTTISHVTACRTCHTTASHVTACRTCHTTASHVTACRTCHTTASHVTSETEGGALTPCRCWRTNPVQAASMRPAVPPGRTPASGPLQARSGASGIGRPRRRGRFPGSQPAVGFTPKPHPQARPTRTHTRPRTPMQTQTRRKRQCALAPAPNTCTYNCARRTHLTRVTSPLNIRHRPTEHTSQATEHASHATEHASQATKLLDGEARRAGGATH
jgi:hypothetical protein